MSRRKMVDVVIPLVFVGVVLSGVIWLNYANYKECRSHGFSKVYCISGHR